MLQDDTIDQKTSSEQRNRVAYTGQAGEAPIQSAAFALSPQMSDAPLAANGQFQIVSLAEVDGDGNSIGTPTSLQDANLVTVLTPTGQTLVLIPTGSYTDGGVTYSTFGNQHPGNSGYGNNVVLIPTNQLVPRTQVPTGNSVLDMTVTFAAVTPDVKPVTKTLSIVIPPDQAAQIQALLGGGSGTLSAGDSRIDAMRPFIATMGDVRWETDHTTPNLYTYRDVNKDGVPDITRQGTLTGLFAKNDGKFEVTLNSGLSQSVAIQPLATGPVTPVGGFQVLGNSISSMALGPNQALVSANGRYMTAMQSDGNLTVTDLATGHVLWSAGTTGGSQAAMQTDGNLVIYGTDGKAKWDSKTGSGGAMRNFTLAMQDDGNLVVSDSQDKRVLWTSVAGRNIAEAPGNEPFTPMFSYTANNQAEADAVGQLSNVLMLYLASHPNLYALYLSQPQANASGNLTLIYEWAQANGLLPQLEQLLVLSAPPQGTDPTSLLQDMITKGAQIAQLKQDLGITADPSAIALDPGAAAYGQGETLRLLDYAIVHNLPVQPTADPAPIAAPLPQAQTAGLTVLGDTVSNGPIRADQALVSANGRYMAVMKADGDFEVYDGANLIWSSGTAGVAQGGAVTLQRDGNLGIYNADKKAQWYSATSGGSATNRAFTLAMQDDGNLVLYDSQGGSALWSTLTGKIARAAANADPQVPAAPLPVSVATPEPVPAPAPYPQFPGLTVLGSQISKTAMTTNQALVSPNGRYLAVMQTDGNAVVYDTTLNQAIWNSGTAGKAKGGFVNVQEDGNLVVYDPTLTAQWNSKTDGGAGTRRAFTLAMQDDGNLVIYDSQGGNPLWSTVTGTIARAAPNAIAA